MVDASWFEDLPDDFERLTELQTLAEELRRELPNAGVTDEVACVADADDRPTANGGEALRGGSTTIGKNP